MKLTNPLRHVGFGNLGVFVRGTVSYCVSPYALKAFDNPIKRTPRIIQRCMDNVIHIVPYAFLAWYIHGYVEKKYDEMNRKGPNDYVDDQ